MKKLSILLCAMLCYGMAYTQLITVASGGSLTVTSGTTLHADGLTLIPSANFTISDNTLSKNGTITNASVAPAISRAYLFSNNTAPFSGTIQVDYTDGVELNGIAESMLELNIHDGTLWGNYIATTNDITNNYVLTNVSPSVILKELSLADLSAPLPLTWLSFTATKQDQTALLKWSTAQELNTRDFTVQHSIDGNNWINIGILPAAGNSSNTENYRFVHDNPTTGFNYYRILQTDIDNQFSYTDIRILNFDETNALFVILGNPVTNDLLTLKVNQDIRLSVSSINGHVLWEKNISAGMSTFDVSQFAKGMYLLKANDITRKVVIQ